MSVFEKYKLKRPSEFTRLVGVNYGIFQIILEKLENEITRYKQQKPMRQRGLTDSLTIADYNQVPSEWRGYVAVAIQKEFLKLENNSFYPNRSLT